MRGSASSASGSRRYSGITLSPVGGAALARQPATARALTRWSGEPSAGTIDPGRFEHCPEAYRPVPHRQPARGAPASPSTSGRHRGRRDDLARRPSYAATNASPRRASSDREDAALAVLARAAASARSVETPTSSAPRRLRERAGGRDADPQAGERARARADARSGRGRRTSRPGLVEQPRGERQELRGVARAARPAPGRGAPRRASPSATSATTVAGRRGVEGRGRGHAAHSIVDRGGVAAGVLERHAHAAASSVAAGDLRPLDERDVLGVDVVGEQRRAPRRRGSPAGAGRGGRPATRAVLVAAADRERRARHRAASTPERPRRAAHERRLPRPHLAVQHDDVAGPQLARATSRAERRRSPRADASVMVVLRSASGSMRRGAQADAR